MIFFFKKRKPNVLPDAHSTQKLTNSRMFYQKQENAGKQRLKRNLEIQQ